MSPDYVCACELDLTIYMTLLMTMSIMTISIQTVEVYEMKTANIADFKKHLSAFLDMVEKGETIQICRRNLPIAQVTCVGGRRQNRTVLGCGEGTVTFHGSLTDPLIPTDSWNMLRDDGDDGDGI